MIISKIDCGVNDLMIQYFTALFRFAVLALLSVISFMNPDSLLIDKIMSYFE